MTLARAALLSALALAACQAAPPAPDPGPEQSPPSTPAITPAPIVNGDTETGWPSVGALTFRFNDQYAGSFCTGTLIAPDWVLTAGHCVTSDGTGPRAIRAANSAFLVGTDARVADDGGPVDGQTHAVHAFVPHPDYNPTTNVHDIALVHLAEPVTDVTPSAFSAHDLAALLAEHTAAGAPLDLFTVGFGATEGITSSGSGLKRSTTVSVDEVTATYFVSTFKGSGTCYGDSGGPGFITVGDAPFVAGVTSAGSACPPGHPDCDTCQTSTIDTRVDTYADWIQLTLESGPPTCHTAPGLCLCAEACQDDASCDDSVCKVATCRDTYSCAIACVGDADCLAACYGAALPAIVPDAEAIVACDVEHCAEHEPGTSARRDCARAECRYLYNACTGWGPTTTGDEDCAFVYDCLSDCQDHDCVMGCLNRGTEAAQLAFEALSGCLNAECRDAETEADYQRCAHERCAAQIDACYPVVSGDASCAEVLECSGMCVATQESCLRRCKNSGTLDAQAAYTALTGCVDTECAGLAPLERISCTQEKCASETLGCTPEVVLGAGCALEGGGCPEGTACVASGEGTQCALSGGAADGEACAADATPRDCGDGLVCHHPPTGAAGTCGPPCTDADSDGACAAVDCADTDATAWPGAAEVCDDGVDNDCDGAVDDGCAPSVVEQEPEAPKASGGGCAGGAAGGGLAVLAALALLGLRRVRRVAGPRA